MKDDSKARVAAYRLHLKTNRVKYTNIKQRHAEETGRESKCA